MIDHVSIPVRDLASSEALYTRALAEIGLQVVRRMAGSVGYGKQYPEFWINERPDLAPGQVSDGAHVCLRARSMELVEGFYRAALGAGAESDGEPGFRPEYNDNYYAAFVRDADGNRIEVVTFT